MPEQEASIQLRIPDDVRGSYANFVSINSTREEFIMDFGAINPAQKNGIITQRIFMNPGHVKRFIEVLSATMAQYEKINGLVSPATQHQQEIGFATH